MDSMEAKIIHFNFSARYFKLGSITPATKKVWIVLHGYGQLAEYFLRKFNMLDTHNVCVLAPEGLSRFYLEEVSKRAQGGSTRVGATWMTKENRLTDIENYLTFLDAVYKTEIRSRQDIEVTIVGFSQGGATASRWVLENKIKFDRLILWAGIFPDDMDFDRGHQVLQSKKIQLVYGINDPFLTDERLVHMKTLTEKLKVRTETITFEGGHEINEAVLLQLVNFS